MPITICDVSKFAEIALKPVPECHCGYCNDSTHWEFFGVSAARLFECEGCQRNVSWCFGATDSSPMGDSLTTYCDDCAVAIAEFQEHIIALQSAAVGK